MSVTMSGPGSAAGAAPRGAARGAALGRLTRTEFRLFLRERIGPIWGVGFPLVLLIIFGSIPSFSRAQASLGGLTELDLYVPILIAFVIAMLALNALPPVLAGYREKGILRRLATTPVGPRRVLAAQLIVNMSMAVVTLVILLAVARGGAPAADPGPDIVTDIMVLLFLSASSQRAGRSARRTRPPGWPAPRAAAGPRSAGGPARR